jgi:hypothetical protein
MTDMTPQKSLQRKLSRWARFHFKSKHVDFAFWVPRYSAPRGKPKLEITITRNRNPA